MANIDLQSVELRGDNKFVFAMIAPPAPESHPRAALARAAGKDRGLTPSRDGILRVDVPKGAPFLMCAIGDEDARGVEGVTLTVTDPDGKQIDEAKVSDSKVVSTPKGKLAGFVLQEPKPGRWTLKVDAPAGSPDFQVLFWTVPDAEEPLATIDRTLDGLLSPDFITAAAVSLPTSCFFCRVVAWVFAAIILAAGTVVLSVGGVVVGAISEAIGRKIPEEEIARTLTQFIDSGPVMVRQICRWAGACS